MKVLILSQHYPPEPITRLKDLARHLVARGHSVSGVTTYPSYPLGRVYEGYRLALRSRHREAGVWVTRVFALPYRGVEKGKRMLSYLSFAASSLVLGLLPRSLPGRRPDVVYAYHPPLTTGLAAAVYSLVARVPFVYDVQDLWPEAIVAAGFVREGSRLYKAICVAESFVYRRASIIIVISEGMRRNLLGKGVPARKIRVISNWGDPSIYSPSSEDGLRAQLGWQERFVVMVAGNMGLTHGLESVIEAADHLRDDPRMLFAFVGSGAAKPGLVSHIESLRLRNVTFIDQVPQEEAARLINAADAMLIHLKSQSGGEFSVPHRIFSYMLCGKPIIAAAAGGVADLVQSSGCGWVCPPSDPDALAQAIRMAASDPDACRKLGRNGLAVAHSEYSRTSLLSQIEEAIEACRAS
ncbi:MAG TPA: glycosyltransferase family 4 protein [Chloroflexia bacterium]|nr:glycosyltransferase family 4 protein [Chloroflexia bacterium]